MTVSHITEDGRMTIFIPKANEPIENGEWIYADSLEKVEPDPVWNMLNNLEARLQALELQVNSMDQDS